MKKLTKLLLLVLTLGLAYSALVFGLIHSQAQAVPKETADTLIILGAKVNGDPAKPSPVLLERLTKGLAYLTDHPQTQVIVTGGQGQDESASEADVMATYLIDGGIEPTRIIRESESTRTMENLMNASKKVTLGQTVIVSNDFHMYRALMLAKRIGIKDVEGLAAPSKTSAKTTTFVREILALGYGLLFDW